MLHRVVYVTDVTHLECSAHITSSIYNHTLDIHINIGGKKVINFQCHISKSSIIILPCAQIHNERV